MEKHAFEHPGKTAIHQIYKTLSHYFPDLSHALNQLPDPRNHIQYEPAELVMAGISLFMLKQGSRNNFNNARKDPCLLENYHSLFDKRLPHLDSTDRYFRDLPEEELEKIKARVISVLIRKKVLEKEKFRGHYVVAVDGTGMAMFKERHCECCLTMTSKNGVTTYFHNVLEAKLLTSSGLSLSIATEWISNEGKSEFQKQDCERKAFLRLAEKIKKLYPRLPIIIAADGLYPWKGFFSICQANKWKYVVTLKDGSLRSLQEDIAVEKRITPRQTSQLERADKNTRTSLHYHWLNALPYHDHQVNYIECHETTVNISSGQIETQRFVYLTNLAVDNKSCDAISFTGRLRQKIENEGFNTQKKQGYALEHKFSRVSFEAMKNYYQCLQIAHIINQLVEVSQTINTLVHKTFKCTIKYLWHRILTFLVENRLDQNELMEMVSKPFQIRLC